MRIKEEVEKKEEHLYLSSSSLLPRLLSRMVVVVVPLDASTEKYLVTTLEQSICVYHNQKWTNSSALPFRYVRVSIYFHKEARPVNGTLNNAASKA
jgi:seryl-tRNA synthetase